jgi:hypothetical protein
VDRTKKQSQSGNRTKAGSQKAHKKNPPRGSEVPKKPTTKAGYPKLDLPDFTIEEKWIIAGLFLFSLLLRLFFMNDGLFHYDSVDFAIQAERTVEELKIHYAHGMGFPGMAILNGLAYGTDALIRGTQSAELSITLLSIIFGAAAVVIFYLFTKELTQDRFIAFTAALLFSITPLFLSVTTFALSHGASVFFSLLAVFLFQKSEQKEPKLKYGLIILSGLSLGFAVTIRIPNVLFGVLILLLYFNPQLEHEGLIFNKPKLKDLVLTAALFMSALILIFLLLYWPKISTAGLGFITETAEIVKWLGIYSEMTLFLLGWLSKSVNPLGWILMLGGIIYALKAKRYSIILLVWFVLIAMYFLNLSGTVSPRYLIPLLIPIYIFIATALEWIKSKNKLVAAVIIVILVLVMLIPMYPILEFRTQYCGPKEFAYYVQQNTEPDSVVIAVDEWIHIKYYANRTTLTHTQDGNDTKILEFLDRIDNYLDNNTPVYIVETGFSYDPGQKIQKAIVTNYNVTLIGSHLNEDYHKKAMFDGRFEERLFKIQHR